MVEIKHKKLTNFKVINMSDKNGKEYFIIFDEDNKDGNNAFFCWSETLKSQWTDLQNKRDNWKEIEIEYEEREKGNKVIKIFADDEEDNFLI